MKLKKVLFIICLLFISFSMVKVYAKEGDPTCTYKTSNPPYIKNKSTITINVWLEGNDMKVDCGDDRKTRSCAIKDKYVTTLFINDNGTLYCPNKINLGYHSGSGTVEVFYGLHADSTTAEHSTEMNISTVGNGAVSYNAKKEGTKFLACKSGGESQIATYQTKIDSYKKTIEAYDETLTKENITTMNTNLSTLTKSITNSNYCNPEINKMGTQIDTLLTTLDKKVSESTAMTAEEKSDAAQGIASTKSDLSISLSKLGKIIIPDSDNVYECQGLLGEQLIDILKAILKIIQIAAPILTILLGSIDFGSVVISQDQDAMKKAVSKFIKRCIAAIAIFFIPYLVGVLLSMDGVSDWESVDPNCGL